MCVIIVHLTISICCNVNFEQMKTIYIRIRKWPNLIDFYQLQFLDKAMQEELHRIKSSTMRKKSTDKTHPGSFIQTITDRLSDAKAKWNPTLQNWTTNLYMDQAFSLFSFNFSCRMLKLHHHLTIRTSTGRAASLTMEGNRLSNATAAKTMVCVKMSSLYDGSHIHWDTYIYNITLFKI